MFQVLRWGALAFGVFYGFSHQAAITTKDKIAASKHEYERKEKLINEAKAAWAQKNAPKGQGNGCECYNHLASRVGRRAGGMLGLLVREMDTDDMKYGQRTICATRRMLTFDAQ